MCLSRSSWSVQKRMRSDFFLQAQNINGLSVQLTAFLSGFLSDSLPHKFVVIGL